VKLAIPALTELSGLAASRLRPGVFYAHNDSGDGPRIFALTLEGALVSEHELTGAKAEDWEDIAAGPCAAGRCLFVADIGDNQRKRPEVVIYRVDEAALASPQGKAVPAEGLRAVYPDGPHDAETLLADPTSGDLFVITKEESGPSLVFRLPAAASTEAPTTLELAAQLVLPETGWPPPATRTPARPASCCGPTTGRTSSGGPTGAPWWTPSPRRRCRCPWRPRCRARRSRTWRMAPGL
jgi:hypothetical protein